MQSKIQNLANDLEREYQVLMDQVANERENLSTQRKSLTTKSKKLDEREELIKSREAQLQADELLVGEKIRKIRKDETLTALESDLNTLKGKLDEQQKKILDLIAEKDYRLELIAKKERALSNEKQSYKAELEKELQDKLKTLIR